LNEVAAMQPNSSSHRRTFATLAAALALGAGGGGAAALALDGGTKTVERVTAAPATQPANAGSALTVNEIAKRSRGSVVDIRVTGGPSRAEGSGFVIDKRGDIVTNQHVVSGGGSIQVEFANGRKVAGRLVGQDASSDIAVIRVSAPSSELQPLTLGDSSKVEVGDGVVAIGSPFGLPGTVTTGVVSALGRSIKAPNGYTITGAVQTDAPINRGNSGGPLLDAHGNVIGVNSQIDSNSGDSSGVGFAVSSNTVRRVAEALISGKKVTHPYLGVSLTDATGGAGVANVKNGSPADRAGLRTGDVVTAIGGTNVASSAAAVSAIDSHKPGDQVSIAFRRNGQGHEVSVTLSERPA
jgi:putative serine protease PepD